LVLADALAYTKNYNPKVVIDFATLTGACVVSLGDVYTGLFTNSNELANKLSEAGEKSLKIKAIDGAGNETERDYAKVSIVSSVVNPNCLLFKIIFLVCLFSLKCFWARFRLN